MLLDRLWLRPEDLLDATGWEIKPEGACKADECVPLTGVEVAPDGMIDVRGLAEHMGMPLVSDEEHGVWALGPRAGGHVLDSVELGPFVLDDFHGNAFNVADLRGRKVLLVAWASW